MHKFDHKSPKKSSNNNNFTSINRVNQAAQQSGVKAFLQQSRAPRYENQPSALNAIQAKLRVGAQNDKLEQEADKVADQVVSADSMSNNKVVKISKSVATSGVNGIPASDSISQSLNQGSGGQPLNPADRDYFSTRMQTDLKSVRIHSDQNAAQMNSEIGARAFTQGSNIYFGAGEYQPQTDSGKHLVAHELTHVVQQSDTTSNNVLQRQALNQQARNDLKDQIRDEMLVAHADFDLGAVQAERDIRDRASASANAAKALFGIGMTLIIPGFGGLVGGLATRLAISVSTNTASVIGGAIGEIAKTAGNNAIDQAFGSNPRQFFSAITNGFEAAQREERNWIQNNITNIEVLPNDVLVELANYWERLAADNESAEWAGWFIEQWRRFEAQVGSIGPQGTGMVPFGPTPISNDNIPVNITMDNGSTRLALVNKVRVDFTSTLEWILGSSDIRTRYRFLMWIDDDMADAARDRVSSVPTLSEDLIAETP